MDKKSRKRIELRNGWETLYVLSFKTQTKIREKRWDFLIQRFFICDYIIFEIYRISFLFYLIFLKTALLKQIRILRLKLRKLP